MEEKNDKFLEDFATISIVGQTAIIALLFKLLMKDKQKNGS